MSVGFAIHNAPTTHGGIIPATQMRASKMGNLLVVAGDGHFCPKCKVWSTVQKSHDHVIFDGHSVAYANDLLSCGARILPQQSHVVGDSQGQNYSGSTRVAPINNFKSEPMFQYGQKYLLVDDLTAEPLSNVCYEVSKSGSVCVHGKTDEQGYTEVISSENNEEIEITIHTEDGDHNGYCCK